VSGAVAATAATIAAVSLVAGLPRAGGADPPPPPPDGHETSLSQLVTVYFVGDTAAGPRLFSERREFGGRADVLRWSLANVVDGNAQDADYGSRWPARTSVGTARLRDGVLTVDLRGPVVRRPAGMGRPAAEVSVQQVVRTAQAVSGWRGPVTFRHDGRPVATLLGVRTRRPVERLRDDETLAPVSIASPDEQTAVSSPFPVTGQTSTGDSTVRWELVQGRSVVRHGSATARRCCTMSSYRFRVGAPVGTYTLVVRDRAGSIDTKQVRVDQR
jgi:hypothetical protein